MELDPEDKTHKRDEAQLEEVKSKVKIVQQYIDIPDYDNAAKYLDFIVADCPASVKHVTHKIEILLR